MIEIKDLLISFDKLLLSEKIKKEVIKEVIFNNTKILIQDKDIEIKNNSIYLKIKPIYKNEIFLNQNEIFLDITKKLGKKSPKKIN